MGLSPELMRILIFGTERMRRFTQDSPVLPDVWVKYNEEEPGEPVDLLLTPYKDSPPAELYKQLRERMGKPGLARPAARRGMTYNESYVVVRLTFDEIIRIALPLTRWWTGYAWHEAHIFTAGKEKAATKEDPRQVLRRIQRLGSCKDYVAWRVSQRRPPSKVKGTKEVPVPASSADLNPSADLLWLIDIAGAVSLRAGGDETTSLPPAGEVVDRFLTLIAGLDADELPSRPLLWSINLNRQATTAVWKSSLAVKADAARRLFEISCKGLRWAVIDSGIDATHRAFRRRDESDPKKQAPDWRRLPGGKLGTRIVETYDFTRLRVLLDPEQPARTRTADGSIQFTAEDRKRRKVLRDARERVREGRMLDWDHLASLIRVPMDADYVNRIPRNAHGTHVAGILAGDWRLADGFDQLDSYDLQGMCPDLELIDLRVFDDSGRSDEFTLIAALQFVRHLNSNKTRPYIHGVNLSLSLFHNVMNFACGRTPICDECHRLINTGTVVVAAAGNEGYGSFKTRDGDKEGYRHISITDPGNAEEVITVGATHRNHPFSYGVSYFSSRGPTGDGRAKPDLVAPGEKITASIPGDGIDTLDGTSMAAPHVSGAAAMLMARYEELIGDPARIKNILCKTATDLGRERFFQGSGMLDVLRALQSI